MSTAQQGTQYDVFIAGAGIVACTFARILANAGLRVAMADIGSLHSHRAGENLKNFAAYQHDRNQYGHCVRALMHPASVPPVDSHYTRNALNPKQNTETNLPGAVLAYAVGGMAIHWTCAILRHHKTLERIPFIPSASSGDNEGWDDLYPEAESLLNLHTNIHTDSSTHKVVKRVLTDGTGLTLNEIPLAAERVHSRFVRYTGADTVLGELAEIERRGSLTILSNHRVTRLQEKAGKIEFAEVRSLETRESRNIRANAFVVAAGWLHTTQILWNSRIHCHKDSALGRYLSDHTFVACTVTLHDKLVAEIGKEAGAQVQQGEYSLPIPMYDPPPSLYIPLSQNRLWHSMIFREAFQFDPLPPGIDERVIVDLKWFGMIDPVASNRVTFDDTVRDKFGMPQPTFEFQLGTDDKARQEQMLQDLASVAPHLGDYLNDDAKPRVIPLGASTHTMGAVRIGPDTDQGKTSVANSHSQVWGIDNLYVGGNCLIPTRNAVNPTLTSVALALRAARHLRRTLTGD